MWLSRWILAWPSSAYIKDIKDIRGLLKDGGKDSQVLIVKLGGGISFSIGVTSCPFIP